MVLIRTYARPGGSGGKERVIIGLGVDVGGTNTDIILTGLSGGGTLIPKLPTTRDDAARATVQGTLEICEMARISPADIEIVLHGTTVATNALLEHDGSRTGTLTTAGFRDIIHIGRHQRPHNFSLMQDIAFLMQDIAFQRWPLVERKYRKAVPERILPPGEVAVALDEDRTVEAIRELAEEGVESICVCFLFLFLNPAHEIRAGELLAEHHPSADVSLSHQVIAQFREFARFTTAAVNAFVKPKVRGYLEHLERGWRAAGVACPIHVMQSNGGVASIDEASNRAVNILLSGPAAGVIAGQHVGRAAGYENLITLDIGGTSADISVVPGRLLELGTRDSKMGGYPILSPKLDVTAIGVGGGSIAWRDVGGAFNVGPRSAGAIPGPACYAAGGTEPTVTDAHVVLRRIDPDRFLGGRLRLDAAAARAAVESRGRQFGMDPEQAALAILAIVNANMINEIRVHSIRRGYDPPTARSSPFGGAGPLHACELAAELEIPTILLSLAPGITSAMGLLATDLRYDSIRTAGMMLAGADRDAVERAFAEMEADLRERLAGHAPTVHREAACRYAGQGYELAASCDDLREDRREQIAGHFHAQHQHEYGFHFAGDPIEIVNLRVTAVAEVPTRPGTRIPRGSADAGDALTGMTDVVFATAEGRERRSAATYDRTRLRAGNRLHAPAVVHEMDSTVVVLPGWSGDLRTWVARSSNVFAHNHPYRGASHSLDIAVIAPIFWDGELIALSANTAHHLDIGGAQPGGTIDLFDMFAEGRIFNATFLYREGRRDDNMWFFFQDNNRAPREVMGDLSCQVAAAQHGVRRMLAMNREARVGDRARLLRGPEGTIFNPRFPAATQIRFNPINRVVDLLLQALAPVMPERTTAGNSAQLNGMYMSGVYPDGNYWITIEVDEGSYGGRPGKDEMDAVHCLSANIRNQPIEDLEMHLPFRFYRYELIEREFGHGRWRGGTSAVRDYAFLTPAQVTTESERHWNATQRSCSTTTSMT